MHEIEIRLCNPVRESLPARCRKKPPHPGCLRRRKGLGRRLALDLGVRQISCSCAPWRKTPAAEFDLERSVLTGKRKTKTLEHLLRKKKKKSKFKNYKNARHCSP